MSLRIIHLLIASIGVVDNVELFVIKKLLKMPSVCQTRVLPRISFDAKTDTCETVHCFYYTAGQLPRSLPLLVQIWNTDSGHNLAQGRDQSFFHGLGSSPLELAILLKPFQFSIAVTIMAIFATFENHFIFAIFG
ncbi:hypothetical protein P5673_019274 [Acropora cervicornis]|uniref:Uncharacterized protein n=1 Tax=Acropora cervicornis TaxID=6130 RepID=A0AAD9QC13_ACRCE|nr:hypothetical protein P5673_019274 [Acropora cervicornis]